MAKITQSALIDQVAGRTGKTKKDVKLILNEYLCSISEALVAGDDVAVSDFGTFAKVQRGERTGHNIRTGEKIVIPARQVVRFKPSRCIEVYTQIHKR